MKKDKNKLNVRELVEKYQANCDRITEMANTCETEQRARTEAETTEYEALVRENQLLQMKMQAASAEYLRENPNAREDAVKIIQKQMSLSDKPICGICMGNQLLAKAAGAHIYKLKYGHRSHNQPVRMVGTEKCFVTSQNHGYAVDAKTLGADWEELFVNMNDGSNEGIRHKSKPWFSSQFHPEACSGPVDTEFMFDKFVEALG